MAWRRPASWSSSSRRTRPSVSRRSSSWMREIKASRARWASRISPSFTCLSSRRRPCSSASTATSRSLASRSALVPDLAQAVDLPAQSLDALEHRGEVDTAGRDLADNGRLGCLIGFDAAPEGRHLPLDIALARRHLGHARLESLELLARGGRLRDELLPFRPQRLEVAPYPIGLAPGRLDVFFAGEARGLLRMDGYLQQLLTGPE